MTNQDRLIIRGMFTLIMNAVVIIIYHGSGTHGKDVEILIDDRREFTELMNKAEGWGKSE